MSDENVAVNRVQSATSRPSDILTASTTTLITSGFGLATATGLYWMLPIGPDILAVYMAIGITTILGLALGYRAQSLAVRPFTAAIGVSWRIGLAWVLLAAVVEFVVTDFTASMTMNAFPIIFLPTLTILVPTVLAGYVAGIIRHKATWAVVMRDVVPIVALLISVVGLLFQFSNEDKESNPKEVRLEQTPD